MGKYACGAVLHMPMVMTACCVAFAHGSNDVGNSVVHSPSAFIMPFNESDRNPDYVTFCGRIYPLGRGIWQKSYWNCWKKITSLTFSKGFAAQHRNIAGGVDLQQWACPYRLRRFDGCVAGVGMASNENSVDLNVYKEDCLGWFAALPAAGVVAAIIYAIWKRHFKIIWCYWPFLHIFYINVSDTF